MIRIEEVARAIDAAEQRVRGAVPEARLIYLEPDLDRSGSASDPSKVAQPVDPGA
jgi:hypothetical protein